MKAFDILCVIAWRNLWRNRRRTLLTAGTISGGLALLLVFLGLGDGVHRQMLRNAVQMGGAHVAVQARGYQMKKAIGLTLPAGCVTRLASTLSDRGFGPATVVRRVFASGLASSSDGSSSVSIVGIEPQAEARVSLLDEKLVAGTFFGDGAANSVVIGQGVARKLKLSPGNKFVLMAPREGSAEIQSVLIRVAGVIRTGVDDIDQFTVLAPLATTQGLLGLEGRIHQAALVLGDADQTAAAAELIRSAEGAEVEVLRWDELMPGLRDLIKIDIAGLFITGGIFFLIIAFLVANTLLMSVLERGREFALLDALGLTPVRRFVLIMLEAAWIAILAAASGAAAGYAGHTYFRTRGLRLFMFFDQGFVAAGTSIDPVVYSALAPGRMAFATGLIFVLTVLLALTPAWKAATEADAHLLGQA
jgi:ABC-type lipoprotein release transport system permease subunit